MHMGYLTYEGDSLEVTPEGKRLVQEDALTRKRRPDGGWIDPAHEARTPKIAVDQIYLPRKKAVSKLRKSR